jgi:prepilin-type N-terminal cleavage/methylation domain-containing protein
MKTPISTTNKRRGFTLVEMMFVVLILGVLATLVVARLDRTLPGHRMRAAVTTIVSVVDKARSDARLKGVTVFVVYDIEKGRVALSEPAPPPAEGEPPRPAGEEYEVVVDEALPEGVKISTIRHGKDGTFMFGSVAADIRPSGAVGEHMVMLEDASGERGGVFVPALVGAAFAVDGTASYEELRAYRRLR